MSGGGDVVVSNPLAVPLVEGASGAPAVSNWGGATAGAKKNIIARNPKASAGIGLLVIGAVALGVVGGLGYFSPRASSGSGDNPAIPGNATNSTNITASGSPAPWSFSVTGTGSWALSESETETASAYPWSLSQSETESGAPESLSGTGSQSDSSSRSGSGTGSQSDSFSRSSTSSSSQSNTGSQLVSPSATPSPIAVIGMQLLGCALAAQGFVKQSIANCVPSVSWKGTLGGQNTSAHVNVTGDGYLLSADPDVDCLGAQVCRIAPTADDSVFQARYASIQLGANVISPGTVLAAHGYNDDGAFVSGDSTITFARRLLAADHAQLRGSADLDADDALPGLEPA